MHIRKAPAIPIQTFDKCHDGVGALQCRSLLDGCGTEKLAFMHADTLQPGVSIGAHTHVSDEEVYYLAAGRGVLLYDGASVTMEAGDVSVCLPGHTHGFEATEVCTLIVVGSR